jgi:AAA15 family ATPase/GTPase|tara:strand:- start:144 stop:362 length:219 start_codon:yes stop_codon:yes gene_type:complete
MSIPNRYFLGKKMKIISKHLHLSADVCDLLKQKKIKDRRSESSIVDEIIRNALENKINQDAKKIIEAARTVT